MYLHILFISLIFNFHWDGTSGSCFLINSLNISLLFLMGFLLGTSIIFFCNYSLFPELCVFFPGPFFSEDVPASSKEVLASPDSDRDLEELDSDSIFFLLLCLEPLL